MNKCLLCNTDTKNPKFCSRSCSVKLTNTISPKRKPEHRCRTCNIPIGSGKTFCKPYLCHTQESNLATLSLEVSAGRPARMAKIQKWMEGLWSGGDHKLSQIIRDYLLTIADNKCCKCGFSGFHPSDGRTILEINHIDGDGQNHRPENLEVLCPNCHAMTTSYRGRNTGNGRPVYYTRTYKL